MPRRLDSVSIHIDATEAREAAAVLQRWQGREGELPPALRAELRRLQAMKPERLFRLDESRPEQIAVVVIPELRALIANLRAREPASLI